jgi:drug/metabolite transporter (DMT)-like permease
MEIWYLLTLFGAILYACAILTDKINFKNYVKDPLALVPVTAIVYMILILAASPLFGGVAMPDAVLITAFFTGILNLIGFGLYFKAIYVEESTSVSAILRLIPVFVLAFGFLFLGETFSVPQYLGVVLLVIGAFGGFRSNDSATFCGPAAGCCMGSPAP